MKSFALQTKIDYEHFQVYGLVADYSPEKLAFLCNKKVNFYLQLHQFLSEKYDRCIYSYQKEQTNEAFPFLVHLMENETRELKANKTRYLFSKYKALNYIFVFQNSTPSITQQWMKLLQTELKSVRFIYPIPINKLDNKEILEIFRV